MNPNTCEIHLKNLSCLISLCYELLSFILVYRFNFIVFLREIWNHWKCFSLKNVTNCFWNFYGMDFGKVNNVLELFHQVMIMMLWFFYKVYVILLQNFGCLNLFPLDKLTNFYLIYIIKQIYSRILRFFYESIDQ